MSRLHCELYRREGDEILWDWRIRAENHEIVATSGGQGYVDKANAIAMCRRITTAGAINLVILDDGDDD